MATTTVANNATWISALIDKLPSVPVLTQDTGMFVLGTLFGVGVSWVFVKMLALKPQEYIVKEWKAIKSERDREISDLKKELKEKDNRINECHAEIDRLRSLVGRPEVPAKQRAG